jgi:tRNA pseudouridine38-40 synthase
MQHPLRFDAWMQSIDSYGGYDLLYLNQNAVIPADAIVRKGEKRVKPFKDQKRFDATGFEETNQNKVNTIEGEEEDDTIIDKSRLADMEG